MHGKYLSWTRYQENTRYSFIWLDASICILKPDHCIEYDIPLTACFYHMAGRLIMKLKEQNISTLLVSR